MYEMVVQNIAISVPLGIATAGFWGERKKMFDALCNDTHRVKEQGTIHTLRSPEMLAPARIPVADGKKIENMPKKLPSFPRQSGTKLVAKMSADEKNVNCQSKGFIY